MELMKLMKLKADPKHGIDVMAGICSACHGTHYDLIEYMIQEMKIPSNIWRRMFKKACCGGNKEVVELIITKGQAQGMLFDWNEGFRYAEWNSHEKIMQLMVSKGATIF
jgi:hypothetical protein